VPTNPVGHREKLDGALIDVELLEVQHAGDIG